MPPPGAAGFIRGLDRGWAMAASAGVVGFLGEVEDQGGLSSGVDFASLKVTGATAILLLLNLVDALCTLTWVQLDIAREANPVMALALQGSPVLFMLSKMFLVQVGTWLLAVHSHAKVARVALHAGCTLYAAIALWHLAFFARVLST